MEMIKRLFEQPWFWPQDVREDPGFINRMGRVFHWTWVAISVALFVTSSISGALGIPMYMHPEFALWCLGIGVVTWMIGRGVRYIFSGE
jgi:hypothetical protein